MSLPRENRVAAAPPGRGIRLIVRVIAAALLVVGAASCDRQGGAPPPTPGKATVASLVPAVTDLILAMGAGDRLVAVSTYDVDRDGTRGLPRVGDYQTTDWEQVAALRPAVMVRQFAPDRVPAGLRDRADRLGVRLLNVQINTLDDVFAAAETVGDALGEPAKAAALTARLRGQLDAVRRRAAGRPRVTALIVHDEAAEAVVGPHNFLDDELTIAGGTNAAAGLNQPYPTIDRETLRALNPDVIIQLLPAAPPQRLEQAKRVWANLPDLAAVRAGRVVTLTDWYVELPGAHVGDVAEKFAAALAPRGGE